MNAEIFGAYYCTSSGEAHYWLPGAKTPLCGDRRLKPGETSGRLALVRQPPCWACRKANVARWVASGEAKK